MSNDRVQQKLTILADAAKYDVSCASNGSNRPNASKGIGSSVSCGICHSFTEDGRCVSLFKILMTNYCIYDCAYCINRRSNDRPRATFTVDEIVRLTIGFYRRNYIEGLFLSSGVIKSPDYTMEQMVQVVRKLRLEEKFNGYIHMKTIPGASEELSRTMDEIAGESGFRAAARAEVAAVLDDLPPALRARLAPDDTAVEALTDGLAHTGAAQVLARLKGAEG